MKVCTRGDFTSILLGSHQKALRAAFNPPDLIRYQSELLSIKVCTGGHFSPLDLVRKNLELIFYTIASPRYHEEALRPTDSILTN